MVEQQKNVKAQKKEMCKKSREEDGSAASEDVSIISSLCRLSKLVEVWCEQCNSSLIYKLTMQLRESPETFVDIFITTHLIVL